jgi:hypothetical protein
MAKHANLVLIHLHRARIGGLTLDLPGCDASLGDGNNSSTNIGTSTTTSPILPATSTTTIATTTTTTAFPTISQTTTTTSTITTTTKSTNDTFISSITATSTNYTSISTTNIHADAPGLRNRVDTGADDAASSGRDGDPPGAAGAVGGAGMETKPGLCAGAYRELSTEEVSHSPPLRHPTDSITTM